MDLEKAKEEYAAIAEERRGYRKLTDEEKSCIEFLSGLKVGSNGCDEHGFIPVLFAPLKDFEKADNKKLATWSKLVKILARTRL